MSLPSGRLSWTNLGSHLKSSIMSQALCKERIKKQTKSLMLYLKLLLDRSKEKSTCSWSNRKRQRSTTTRLRWSMDLYLSMVSMKCWHKNNRSKPSIKSMIMAVSKSIKRLMQTKMDMQSSKKIQSISDKKSIQKIKRQNLESGSCHLTKLRWNQRLFKNYRLI